MFASRSKSAASGDVADTSPSVRFRDAAPEWAQRTDKLAELTAREAELIEKLRPLNEALARTGEFSVGIQRIHQKQTTEVEQHSPAVQRLLGDLTPPARSPAPFNLVEGPIKEKWREVSDELDAVRTAISVIHEPLKRAWLNGSAAYCERVAPDYRAVVADVCAALIAAAQAMLAHEKFLKDLREQGVAWGMLKPISISGLGLGSPLEATSELSRMLKWAVECGHLPAENIPREFAARRR